MKQVLIRSVFALLLLAGLPAAVFAQASITGIVRDTSGAVLPGVTVEAASPVIIEKVRSATTDGTGRYHHSGPPTRHLSRDVYAARIQKRGS